MFCPQVNLIVMLSNPVENGESKVHCYWPHNPGPQAAVRFGPFSIHARGRSCWPNCAQSHHNDSPIAAINQITPQHVHHKSGAFAKKNARNSSINFERKILTLLTHRQMSPSASTPAAVSVDLIVRRPPPLSRPRVGSLPPPSLKGWLIMIPLLMKVYLSFVIAIFTCFYSACLTGCSPFFDAKCARGVVGSLWAVRSEAAPLEVARGPVRWKLVRANTTAWGEAVVINHLWMRAHIASKLYQSFLALVLVSSICS